MQFRKEQDYYAILGVPDYATPEELRTAYRNLAKKLHPDVSESEELPQKDFSAISEAYEVLSNPERRAQYDESRWQQGFVRTAKKPAAPSCHEFLHQAEQLRAHMQQIDRLRMNHEVLREYVLDLLRDENLQCLTAHPECRSRIFECVFESIQSLALRMTPELAPAMTALAGADTDLRKRWETWFAAREKERYWNRYRPVIVLLSAALICVLLWWLARP